LNFEFIKKAMNSTIESIEKKEWEVRRILISGVASKILVQKARRWKIHRHAPAGTIQK
jgi:hypothetical protein